MKRLLILLSLSFILSGCSSINRNVSNLVFPPYGDSDQRQGEVVTLNLNYHRTLDDDATFQDVCPQPNSSETRIIPASAIGTVAALQFATDQVQQFLKKEAERYTASYSAVAVGDHFYRSCNPSEGSVDLKEIVLTRSIDNAGKVMELIFDIKPTLDGTAFQIKPRTITMKQSKAKITAFDISKPFGFDILAPWTIFKVNSLDELSPLRPNTLDVTAEISITAVWIDQRNEIRSELIASRKMKFSNIALGDDQRPLPDTAQLFPAIPRSKLDGNPSRQGLGNFIISVMVTEYDDYAERVMELEQGVEKNKDSFIERLTDGL